jgi:hypothetical protein
MDDEPSSAWLIYLIGIWVLAGVAFIVLGTGMARAQQRPLQCVRMEQLMRGMTEVLHEKLIWQGIKTTASGPTETFLFQSQDGKTWTQVDVVGKDENGKPIGCFVGIGTNGNPNDMGKGV